jgi:hypothetical protein
MAAEMGMPIFFYKNKQKNWYQGTSEGTIRNGAGEAGRSEIASEDLVDSFQRWWLARGNGGGLAFAPPAWVV